MQYKELATLYHMDTSPERNLHAEHALEQRLTSDSTFRLKYATKEGELFIASPRELVLLNNKVLKTERTVSHELEAFPALVSRTIMRGLVLGEVVSSNAIESVHSTRRQIRDALESGERDNSGYRRFKELATLYMDLLDQTYAFPQEPADIRSIYDKVMDGELGEGDKPDGKLFRAGGVEVTDGIRVLHIGVQNEAEIMAALEAMIALMNSDEVPPLYAALASHYLFEYAHPFYDGNGRTGRYLLALYLSETLSMPTSLSLSRTIAERKQTYYRAFKSAQNPLNHGELTHFILDMLGLVSDAQDSVLKHLHAAQGTLDELEEKMQFIARSEELKQKEAEAVFMLVQYEAFGCYGDATLSEIAKQLQLGEQMTRKHMGVLEKKGIVQVKRKRSPITFALTERFKERYGVRAMD